MGTFYTKYIRTGLTSERLGIDSARQAEWRIDNSEEKPGRLAIGLYGLNTGDEFATGHTTRKQVVELYEALCEWLAANPAPTSGAAEEVDA